MKIGLLVALTVFAAHGVNGLLDGLNVWVELGLKFAGLAATIGGAWRWLVGPFYRRVRSAVMWVFRQLELIGQLDDRLGGIEEELGRGNAHFRQIDEVLAVVRDDYVREARRAIRDGDVVRLTPDGHADRREPV